MKLSILLVEDNRELAITIVDYFESQGHVIDYAVSAELAINLLNEMTFDIVILDLMLPGMNGLQLCDFIKQRQVKTTPILMLTARDTLDDVLQGFSHGADDYLTKPFAMQELAVRVEALSRRHTLNQNKVIKLPPLRVDRLEHKIFRDGHEIKCSKMGFNIVTILAEAFPRIVSRTELSIRLWGDGSTDSDVLRTHMYQLRTSIDKPFEYPILKTIHGVGFTLQNVSND